MFGFTANSEIRMSAATTANLRAGRYMYDVLVTSSSGNKIRAVEGIVNVLPGVTRT